MLYPYNHYLVCNLTCVYVSLRVMSILTLYLLTDTIQYNIHIDYEQLPLHIILIYTHSPVVIGIPTLTNLIDTR